MGTNYYASVDWCGSCFRSEQVHIGKSSAGWAFSLHAVPEKGLNSLYDWIKLLTKVDVRIKDEYERDVSLEELLTVILCRGSETKEHPKEMEHGEWDKTFNVYRYKDKYCLSHGHGPWDLIEGEFS